MKTYLLGLLGFCALCLLISCGDASGSPPVQLAITSAAPPYGLVGSAYAGGGFALTATGGNGTYRWNWAPASGSALPPGLTLSGAVISGTPTTANTYNVVVTVTDAQAARANASYQITITTGLAITSLAPPSGAVGVPYGPSGNGFPITISGGIQPYNVSWAASTGSNLPPGLNLNNGKIFGTPTSQGSYDVVVTATDSQSPTAKVSAPYTISIGAVAITSGNPPDGFLGAVYGTCQMGHCSNGFGLAASGGTPPYGFTWTGLPGSSTPPGLAIRFQTLTCQAGYAICGTPTAGGTYDVVVTVIDSASPPNQGTANYRILISGGSGSAATSSSVRSRAAVASSSGVPRYELIDLGTFGGPASYFANGFDGILNNHGAAVGGANTSTPDPFCFPAPNCFAEHAFLARNGRVTDLGALEGGSGSLAVWISANGLIVGLSQNGEIDPLIPGFPEVRGALWRDGKIVDLGTLPDGGFESSANAVNNRAQVVGIALNTVDDPCSLFGFTQARAFLWQNGAMQDLGTLGGPDADAELINDAGQIAGISYTHSINPATGCPSLHTFFWQNGTMSDVGTLGGTSTELAALNQRGEVAGISNLAGDQTFHPFHWSKGQLTDLGTLGGDTGWINWINDRGEIVGKADLPGPAPQLHDAVLWKSGQKIDLGVLPGDSCSNAYFVNSHGQIVGASEPLELCTLPEPIGQHAFLRDPGGPLTDLNTLIPPGATLDLTYAVAINDRGEIAGFGVPPDCTPQDVGQCGHAYMLIPCGVGEECVNATLSAGTDLTFPLASNSTTTRSQSLTANPVERFKSRIRKFHLPGHGGESLD